MASQLAVPFLDLRVQYRSIRAEIESAIGRVLESQQFILGPEVAALEGEIARYCGARRAVGCASGSDALLLALMALGVGPGDEVVCPAFTFFATGGAIARLGALPVFADIDPASYNLDLSAARKAAEGCQRLRALLPVHLFGQAAEGDALGSLARELGVPLIEDAAQALGARDSSGGPAGTRGAFGCFSFYPTKNLGAFGDAGMVTTDNEEGADRIARLRVHGGETPTLPSELGINSHLDALQAAVLRVKLQHLERWTEGRRSNAAHYDRAFAELGAPDSSVPLEASDDFPLRTPKPPDAPARHIYNQYVVRVPRERRDPLREALAQRGIETGIYYPRGLHQQACFRAAASGELPETERACSETLALPVYPELRPEQLDHVVAATANALT